jgi:predicted PurR-regulated permease PerM
MAIARRIGAGVVLVLAAVGLIVCLAVIVAVWAARPPVDDTVDTSVDTLVGYLDLASGDIQQVDASLVDAQGAVNSVTQQAQQGQVAPNLAADLAPRLQRLSDLTTRIQSSLGTLQKGVEAADRLPSVDTSTLQGRLERVNNGLTQVQSKMNDMQAAIAQRDNPRIAAASTTVSGAITDARNALADAQANIANTRTSLINAEEQISRWTVLAALAFTLLFLLLGAGQVSLIAHAWSWMRKPKKTTVSAPPPSTKTPEQSPAQPARGDPAVAEP